MTVNRNEDAMIGSRFGRISKPMIRQLRSPVTRADSTKSRLRSDSVWARSTRAPEAQPVMRDDQADQHVVRAAPARQEADDHDQQRQRGHDQEDVGQHRQQVVGQAAEVAGRHAEDHREHGGDRAGEERDQDACSGCRPAAGRACPAAAGWCRASARPTAAAAGRDVVDRLVPGSYGAIHGPMTASITKISASPRPMLIFGDLGSGRPGDRRLLPALLSLGSGPSVRPPAGSAGREQA